MKNKIIFCFLFVWNLGLLHAQPNTTLLEADSLFKLAQYNEALVKYQSIVQEDYHSASLYFNMGNTAYKLNKLALSILYYEKALALDPKDEDILFNINMARELQIDEVEELPSSIFDKLKHEFALIMSSSNWAVISIVFLATALMLFIILMGRFAPWRTTFIGLVITLLFALISTSSAWLTLQVERESYAILMNPNAYVKSAPLDNSDDTFIIHEGIKVRVLEQYKGWIKIKLADGKVGWIQENQLEII